MTMFRYFHNRIRAACMQRKYVCRMNSFIIVGGGVGGNVEREAVPLQT